MAPSRYRANDGALVGSCCGVNSARDDTRARLKDACNSNSKTGAQSYRAVMEASGIVGGPRDVTINGDVDASVNVDARTVAVIASDPVALREALARIEGKLGIG